MNKDLVIFIAHIDDFECACYGYLFKHHTEYENIKIITATTLSTKEWVWEENKNDLPEEIKSKIIDINLGYDQRKLWSTFDFVKDDFYKCLDFTTRFDLLTHDQNDCHTDHTACFNIAKGMYKYCNRFITIYSPSSSHFTPNLFIGINSDQYAIKKKALDKYDIAKEQSYTSLGYYLQSEEHYNIGRAQVLENYVFDDFPYYEIYKILKWL